MNWLRAIFITLPQVLNFIQQIKDALDAGVDIVHVQLSLGKFDRAMKGSSTRELEALFNPPDADPPK